MFLTSARCFASLAETVTAAAASSQRVDRPWPVSQSAKVPASPATPPSLRVNQWVHFISNMVCLCLTPPSTNALNYELLTLVSCCPRHVSQTRRTTARLGHLSVATCQSKSNRCAVPARGQRWVVATQESLQELQSTTPLTRPYVTLHSCLWVQRI